MLSVDTAVAVQQLCMLHITLTDNRVCVYTEHVPPYSAQKMNESVKEYFRCLWLVVLDTWQFVIYFTVFFSGLLLQFSKFLLLIDMRQSP